MRNRGAISMIRRYITLLPEGKIFSTQDVLQFGMRAAVDQALSRLCKGEKLRRLARGVFVKEESGVSEYSDMDIAKVKAESFGRKIATLISPVSDPLTGDANRVPNTCTFLVSGHSSKFRIGDKTIHLKSVSPRKFQLVSNGAG
jgi:hypothetical protein